MALKDWTRIEESIAWVLIGSPTRKIFIGKLKNLYYKEKILKMFLEQNFSKQNKKHLNLLKTI